MLAPWIIDHFPPHRVYTEAFGGAASVLLRKPRSYAEVYNDLDGEVVNLFRVLQSGAGAARLERVLRATPFARAEFELAYKKSKDPVERARRLIIVSFMGFGSNGHNTEVRTGFRANSNRSSTAPAHDWANYPECMAAFVERMQRVVIESKDAISIIEQHDQDDALHYVDPPYVHSTRDAGGRQRDYRHEMDDAAHQDLARVLRAARGGGGPKRLSLPPVRAALRGMAPGGEGCSRRRCAQARRGPLDQRRRVAGWREFVLRGR